MSEILNFVEEILVPVLINNGLTLLAILVATYIGLRFGNVFVERLVRRSVGHSNFLTPQAEKQREDTLIRVFSGTLRIIIWTMAILMILTNLGVNITPILAGVGVAGIAFGFGGQYLIRDIISGFFIIFENQYRVGDVISVAGTAGLVEDISLRLTTLRDLDGTVHHIPNGEITTASNLSKFFSRVNLNIGVAYNSNLEKVIEVVNRVGNDLAEDPEWKECIKKAPQFLRVDEFADSAIIIKILGETEPIRQWDVAGELRKRLKIAFDREGIEIPFPQRVIHKAS